MGTSHGTPRKLPTSLDPVEAKFGIAGYILKPLGIPRENEWRREAVRVHWNCNLQHWTDKTASSVQRYVKGTVEWQLHQRFTVGSKQHLEELDEFFKWQRVFTERDRKERQEQMDRWARERADKKATEEARAKKDLEDAERKGVQMAGEAAGSPCFSGWSSQTPWTDQSKQMVGRNEQDLPSRVLFHRKKTGGERKTKRWRGHGPKHKCGGKMSISQIERKIKSAARHGPREFSPGELLDFLEEGSEESSLPFGGGYTPQPVESDREWKGS